MARQQRGLPSWTLKVSSTESSGMASYINSGKPEYVAKPSYYSEITSNSPSCPSSSTGASVTPGNQRWAYYKALFSPCYYWHSTSAPYSSSWIKQNSERGGKQPMEALDKRTAVSMLMMDCCQRKQRARCKRCLILYQHGRASGASDSVFEQTKQLSCVQEEMTPKDKVMST